MSPQSLKRIVLSALSLLLLSATANAQFYGSGTDPGHLRWRSIETPNYQVIYPVGADSLARNYARLLERYRVPTGYSIGLTPGSLQWNKLPVVLHTYNGYANGSVSWAPSRMSLYTVMEPNKGDPAPWELQLVLHEPRHQAQLQLGYKGFLKPLGYLFGEAASPLAFLLYLDLALAEGDAVATETGFGYGTRARTADFLNYYRVALDQGDYRSWDRWRYGSFKHYTPDYYTLGYLTIGGVRYFYDYPLFTADFLQRSLKHPFSFTQRNMMKTAAERSGKPFKETFGDILEGLNRQWREEDEQRKPFIPQEQITSSVQGFPASYSNTIILDGVIYMLRDSKVRGRELVCFKDGKEKRVAPMSASVESLWNDDAFGRLYWSEVVGDARWELSHRSIIRYYDTRTGKIGDLTRKGRRFNPQPSADGTQILTTEYPYSGGNRIQVLSGLDGSVVRNIPVPDGLQVTETAWWKEDIYAIGISETGAGIYKISPEGRWETVFAPNIQKVGTLRFDAGYLEWVSDRSGVNEYYRYYPEENRLVQMTSSRYGLMDVYEWDGFLYYVSQTLDGAMLFRTAMKDLAPREVSYADVHTYPMEEALAAQEKALGAVPDNADIPLSEPKRYYKLPHLLRFHTWLPFFANYDDIESQSLDLSYKTASLGATGFFQNTLGTLEGYVGYSAHPDTEKAGQPWMHSLHGKVTYKGMYPVFEASFDLGGSWARQYALSQYKDPGGNTTVTAGSFSADRPLYSAQLSTYLPLRFNKSGFLAGLVPKIDYSLSNSGFATNTQYWSVKGPVFAGLPTYYSFTGFGEGKNYPMQRLNGSVRGYWMLPVAGSGTYPRLGVGMEVGGSLRPSLTNIFTPSVYVYGYGYLPGLWLPQGLRLTGLYQRLLKSGNKQFSEVLTSILPRGFENTSLSTFAQNGTEFWKVTADYAIPIYVGDLALGRFAYINNFLLTPHFDFSGLPKGNLWSAGADLTAELAHLLFINFDLSVGVSFSYLGGSLIGQTAETKPWHLGMIFSLDL